MGSGRTVDSLVEAAVGVSGRAKRQTSGVLSFLAIPLRSRRAASSTEYVLLLALLGAVLLPGLSLIYNSLGDTFDNLDDATAEIATGSFD